MVITVIFYHIIWIISMIIYHHYNHHYNHFPANKNLDVEAHHSYIMISYRLNQLGFPHRPGLVNLDITMERSTIL